MSRILVISTGGTIASRQQENGDMRADLGGESLLAKLSIAHSVSVLNLLTVGSFALTFEHLCSLAQSVEDAFQSPDVDGVVVTQGTDTLEETSFYLAATIGAKKPVVLTGAQLDAENPSSDGARNLSDALVVAAHAQSRLWGPVVVFNGYVHTARDVRKSDTAAMDTFVSPGWGPVARVFKQQLIAARRIGAYPTQCAVVPERVALIRLALGMTGQEVLQMANGSRGVVLEALGLGNGTPGVDKAVSQLVTGGTPVVVTSRCWGGSTAPVYGAGGGRDLERAGAWFAGDLSGEKARLLLGIALANGCTREQCASLLAAWSNPAGQW